MTAVLTRHDGFVFFLEVFTFLGLKMSTGKYKTSNISDSFQPISLKFSRNIWKRNWLPNKK